MKYFFAITLLVAVASARMVKPTNSELAELEEIIAAINSPSTDPATAAALEEMLLDALGIKPEPVQVGPAVIDATHPISIGPAIIDYPLPEGALVEEPIVPTPVIVAPAPAEEAPVAPAAPAAPLVQIILNINQAAADVSPVSVGPAVTPVRPTPVGTVRPTPEASLPVAIDRPVPEVSLPIHPVGGVKPTQPILAPRA